MQDPPGCQFAGVATYKVKRDLIVNAKVSTMAAGTKLEKVSEREL